MNCTREFMPAKIPPPRCATPNSHCFILVGTTAGHFTGRRSSFTPLREQCPIALLSRESSLSRSISLDCQQRARPKSFVFCATALPFALFSLLKRLVLYLPLI